MGRCTVFREAVEQSVVMKYSIMYNFYKSVREESLKYLSEQGDEWLMSERKWPNGVVYNCSTIFGFMC